MTDASLALREKINARLRSALKERNRGTINALRSVLSALDNASAVAISSNHIPVFGKSEDVPRKLLSSEDCEEIIQREIDTRTEAIVTFTRLNQTQEVEHLQSEIGIIQNILTN